MPFGSLIVVKKDGSDGSKFPLFEGDACKIGPGFDCQVRFGSSTEDSTYCSISLEKNGTIKVQKLSFHPVLVNDSEVVSFKIIQSGDIIKIAPKTFRFELIKKENADNTVIGMISASRKVNKVNQQPPAVPRISARRSLSDFRVAQIRPMRRSMSATLSTWKETESDVNTLKHSNQGLPTQSSNNIVISHTPMKPSSPSVTMNIEQKLTNQAKRRSRRLSKSAETRIHTSPKHLLSNISDTSEKSLGTKRKYFDSSSDSQKSTKIPRRFFPSLVTPIKMTRSNQTPVKPETKVTKTPQSTRKVQANDLQKQATPMTKQEAMQFKTPVSAVKNTALPVAKKTPVSSVKKTPVSAVKKTPVSAVKKTPVSAVKKTPMSAVKKIPVSSVKKTPQSARNKLVSPRRHSRSETKIAVTKVSASKQKASTTTKVYVGSQKSQLKSSKVLTFNHDDEQTHVARSTKKNQTSEINVSPEKALLGRKSKTPKSQTISKITPVLKIRSSKRKSRTNTPKSQSANKKTSPTLKVRTLRTTPIILKKTPPSAKAKKGSASKTSKLATTRIPIISKETAKIDSVQKTLVSNQKPLSPIIVKTTPSPSKLLNVNHMRILFNKTPKSTGKLMSSIKKAKTPSSVPTKLSNFVGSATKSAKKIKIESFSSPEKLNVTPVTVKPEKIIPQVESAKKTPRMGSSRKTPQIGSARKTPRVESAKKTPPMRSEKKTPQMKSAKKTPKVKSATLSAGKNNDPSSAKAAKVVTSSVKKTPIMLTSSRPNNRSLSARLAKKSPQFSSLVLRTPNSEKSVVKKVVKRVKKSPLLLKLVRKTPQSAKMIKSPRSGKTSVEKLQHSQSTSESDDSKYSSTTPKTHAIDELSNSSTERSVRTPESVFNKPPVTPNIKAIKSAKKKSDSITKSIVKRSTVKKRKISDLADTPSKLLKMELADDVYDACVLKEEVNISKTSQTDSPKPKSNSSKRTSIINAENKTLSPEKSVQIAETRSSTRKSVGNSLSKSMFEDQNMSTASSKTSTPKKRLSRKSYTLLSPNNTQGNMDLFNVSDVSLVHNESVASNNASNLTGLSGIHSLPNTSFGSNLIDFGSPRRTPRSKMNKVKIPVAKIMATTTNSPLTTVQQKKLRSSFLLQNTSIAEEQVSKSEPSAVEGLNKLFRSPKINSLPLNDLSNIINVENQNESLQMISTPMKDVQIKSPTPRKSARKTPTNKSQSSIKSPENLRVSSVKKLARTPVQKSPKNDLTKVGGLKKLYKTPVVQKSPLDDLSDVRGVKHLMKTPGNKVFSPKNDLTNVAGVKRLLKTPVAQKSPLNDLSDIKGVKSLMKTPGKKVKSPKNDLTNVAGLKNLFESATAQKSPQNDLSDVRGVRNLMKTPGRNAKSPKNDLTQIGGLKKLYGTPIVQKSPQNDLSDVRGVKSLLKTPGQKVRTPKNDLTDVDGVKTLYKSPVVHKSPHNDLTNVRGVKNLFKTPGRKAKSPKNDLTQVAGVKRLLSSPKPVKSPKNDLSNIENLAYIFEQNSSSAQRKSSILKSSTDVKNSSKNELDKSFDLLYNEEKTSENQFLIVNSTNKTYERKTRSCTPHNPEKSNVPIKVRESVPYTKKSMVILKWIEEQNKGIGQNDKKETTSRNNKELPPRKRFKHVSDFTEQNDSQKVIEKTFKEGSTDIESLNVVERITTKAIIEQSEPAPRSSRRRKLADNSEPVAKSPVKRGNSDIETVSSVPKKRTRRQKVDDEIVVVKESPVTRSNRNKLNVVHSMEVCQEIINKTNRHNVGNSEMVVESVEVNNISPYKSNILNVVGLVNRSKTKGKRVKKNTIESVVEEIPAKKVKFEITSPVEESSPDKEKVMRTRNTRAKKLVETEPAKSTKYKVAVQEVKMEEELPRTIRRRKIIETEAKEVEVKSGATKSRSAKKVVEEKPASPVKTRSKKAKDPKEEKEAEKKVEKETVKKEQKKVTSKSKKTKTTDEQNVENVPVRSTRRRAVVNEEVPQVKAKSTRSKVTEDALPIRKSARTRVQTNT